jgi:hypothetical protein
MIQLYPYPALSTPWRGHRTLLCPKPPSSVSSVVARDRAMSIPAHIASPHVPSIHHRRTAGCAPDSVPIATSPSWSSPHSPDPSNRPADPSAKRTIPSSAPPFHARKPTGSTSANPPRVPPLRQSNHSGAKIAGQDSLATAWLAPSSFASCFALFAPSRLHARHG